MLFQSPTLEEKELAVVAEIDELREKLRNQLRSPQRWLGPLRRILMARAIQGSNSIEGYIASLDDAKAIGLGEAPLDADRETRLAYKGNSEALTYVLQLADEDDLIYSEQLLKSLHFMMINYDLSKRPGRWRLGWVGIRNEATGELVYETPDIGDISALINELIEQLNAPDDGYPVVVRAGMAHLNLAMIHPFADGNGRMARCLQTLVLARERILRPVFSSIEEYLGKNTPAYYAVLAEVGGGFWQPDRDTRQWIRFILRAHLHQGRTVLRRVRETDRLWSDLQGVIKNKALPERVITVLFDAAVGFRVWNAIYRATDKEISDQMASRDLALLVKLGLLEPHGERRGRYYIGTKELRSYMKRIYDVRDSEDMSDPFAA